VSKTKFGLIVASTPKGEIGFQNTIPWRLKGDLARFKALTLNQVIIHGRKTLESLPGGQPLAGRYTIILSKTLKPGALDNELYGTSVQVVGTIEEAIAMAEHYFHSDWAYFVGGAEVYEEALKFVTVAHVTMVYLECYEYDTKIKNFTFPDQIWEGTYPEDQPALKADGSAPGFAFIDYKRRQ